MTGQFWIGFICGILAVPVVGGLWSLSRYIVPREDALILHRERREMMTKEPR